MAEVSLSFHPVAGSPGLRFLIVRAGVVARNKVQRLHQVVPADEPGFGLARDIHDLAVDSSPRRDDEAHEQRDITSVGQILSVGGC
jgi:hypothetical protein